MPLVIEDAFLPATLTAPPMSDQQFADFCADHPDLSIEMTAEGELIIMAPAFPLTGIRNSTITAQLDKWARHDRRGLSLDSSSGFVLPNGARRSPDASWVANDQIKELSKQNLEGFWHLCPAFVIELRSDSDRLPAVRAKMREYIANGAELGWLIDPKKLCAEVYRPNREPETRAGVDSIAGEGPVEGFTLDLRKVWNPLED